MQKPRTSLLGLFQKTPIKTKPFYAKALSHLTPSFSSATPLTPPMLTAWASTANRHSPASCTTDSSPPIPPVDDIFNTDGDDWKFQRQVSNHEFNTKSLRKFVEQVVDTELSDRLITILSVALEPPNLPPSQSASRTQHGRDFCVRKLRPKTGEPRTQSRLEFPTSFPSLSQPIAKEKSTAGLRRVAERNTTEDYANGLSSYYEGVFLAQGKTMSVCFGSNNYTDPTRLLRSLRHSMLHMILENEIYSKDDLRELLNCFLQLNFPYNHDIIIRVFTEIWIVVFSVRFGGSTLLHFASNKSCEYELKLYLVHVQRSWETEFPFTCRVKQKDNGIKSSYFAVCGHVIDSGLVQAVQPEIHGRNDFMLDRG
ncbi:hypothetical protein ACFX1S_009428 [Malus domestica]